MTQQVRTDAGADTLAFVDESGAGGLSSKLTPDRDHELGLVCALLVPASRVQEFRDAFRPGYESFADAMPSGAKLHITDAFASGNESWARVARRVRSEFHGLVHRLGIPLIYEARRLRIDRESHNLLHNIPSPDDSSRNSSPRLRGHPSRSRVESHLVLGLSLKLDAFCADYQLHKVDLLFDNLDGKLARLYRDTIERTRKVGNSTHILKSRHPDPALRTEFKLSFESDSPIPLSTRFLGQLRIAGKSDPLVLAADSLANALYDHLTSLPSDAHLNRPSSIEGWDLAHRVYGVRDDAIEDII